MAWSVLSAAEVCPGRRNSMAETAPEWRPCFPGPAAVHGRVLQNQARPRAWQEIRFSSNAPAHSVLGRLLRHATGRVPTGLHLRKVAKALFTRLIGSFGNLHVEIKLVKTQTSGEPAASMRATHRRQAMLRSSCVRGTPASLTRANHADYAN